MTAVMYARINRRLFTENIHRESILRKEIQWRISSGVLMTGNRNGHIF